MKKTAALILAAGKGLRMQSDVPKQFMEIGGKPLFLYSVEQYLKAADPVIVVTQAEEIDYVKAVLKQYGLFETVQVCAGGRERYDSSMNGLRFLQELGDAETVLIHDAARAAVTEEVIRRVILETEKNGAAIAAVPSKDTVKVADADGFVKETPNRKDLRIIQTPQGFQTELIREAYRHLKQAISEKKIKESEITDDAGVVERFTDHPVKLVMGDYRNIKITTPEDLKVIELNLNRA